MKRTRTALLILALLLLIGLAAEFAGMTVPPTPFLIPESCAQYTAAAGHRRPTTLVSTRPARRRGTDPDSHGS
jgi:hypothetical protein